jgi:rod shape-determining protein MreD
MRHRLALLLLLMALLETTVMPFARVRGVGPDLILLAIMAVALYRGPDAGAIVGLCGGALADIMHGQGLGLFTLAGGATGYLAGLLEPRLFKDLLLVPAFAGFAGTILFQGGFLLLTSFVQPSQVALGATPAVVLTEAVYNAALAPVVFRLTYNLLRSRGAPPAAGKERS